MFLWVRKFWIAMLALAVLAAPCLSTLDIFGAAPAHAQYGAQVDHRSGAQAVNRKQHSDHAGHAHSRGYASIAFADAQPFGPDRDTASCCRLCDGWLTKKGSGDQKAVSRANSTPDSDGDKSILAIPVSAPAVSFPSEASACGAPVDAAESASLSVYALTQRYRL